MHLLFSPGEASHSCPAVAGRETHIEDDGGVAGPVVDVAGGGVDEENLAVRPDSVT